MSALPHEVSAQRETYWAGCATPSFDEFVTTLGQPIQARLTISVEYIGKAETRARWPISIDESARERLIKISALGRTHVALRSKLVHLTTINDRRYYMMEAGNAVLCIYQRSPSAFLDKEFDTNRKKDFIVLGRLMVSDAEPGQSFPTTEVVVHRFESLQLDDKAEGFGRWFPVNRYGELGSDPDVMGANVLVSEIEILGLR